MFRYENDTQIWDEAFHYYYRFGISNRKINWMQVISSVVFNAPTWITFILVLWWILQFQLLMLVEKLASTSGNPFKSDQWQSNRTNLKISQIMHYFETTLYKSKLHRQWLLLNKRLKTDESITHGNWVKWTLNTRNVCWNYQSFSYESNCRTNFEQFTSFFSSVLLIGFCWTSSTRKPTKICSKI